MPKGDHDLVVQRMFDDCLYFRLSVMFSPFYDIGLNEFIVAGGVGFLFFYRLCVHDRFHLVNSSFCFLCVSRLEYESFVPPR